MGYKKLLQRAGRPDVRFHDLRHSCATLLLAQRVPMRVIMEILGHSQITLTMNLYAHVEQTVQHEALAGLDALFPAVTAGGRQ